jgi:peptide/nickel transport system substrate-binding protein
MWEVPGTLVPAMQNIANGKLIEIASPGFQPIVMRSDKKPFDDPRVRKAFKHAINREQLAQIVLKGRGTVARDNPVPPSSIFAAKVDTLPYDPALAKKLLAEAGHASGLKLTLFASHERFGNLESAIVAKQMLEAVGVTVELQQVPWDRFSAEIWRKQDFFVSNWFGRPTVDEQLYPYFHSTGSWNEYHYKNARVDELLDRGRGTVDVEERKKLYAEVQQILASEGPAIIPYFSNYISAVNNRVKGYTPHALKWVELREVYLEG